MNGNDEVEEGECSDDSLGEYTPLARPEVARPQVQPAKQVPLPESDPESEASADSESDSDSEKPVVKRRGGVVDPDGAWGRHIRTPAANDGGGATFLQMAAAFQAERAAQGLPTRGHRKNNVWGSLIQEESLTAELGGVGVGRTLKDLNSDRGAETYDFTIRQEERKKEREEEEREKLAAKHSTLDDEMTSYWARRGSHEEEEQEEPMGEEKERRGRKRNVRDRLGQKQDRRRSETQLLAQGTPHEIVDLDPAVVHDGSDEDLGTHMAARLHEQKEEMIVRLIEIIGRGPAVGLFEKTQLIEAEGGMMIKNGSRRRTPGGCFLQLLRETDHPEIDKEKVRAFFNDAQKQEQRQMLKAKKKKKKKNFEKEMEDFLKAKKAAAKAAKAKEAEMAVDGDSKVEEMDDDILDKDDSDDDDGSLKPLPNILSLIAETISEPKGGGDVKSGHSNVDEMEDPEIQKFVEPEAPPNSVERPLQDYDDDFLKTTDETEGIELF